jgi:hypothetical protein
VTAARPAGFSGGSDHIGEITEMVEEVNMGTLCPHCNKGIIVTFGKPTDVAPPAPPAAPRESSVPPLPGAPPRPHGLAAIRATFGEPGAVPLAKARIPDVFRKHPYLAKGTLTCHKHLVARVEWIFSELERRGLADLIEEYGGCYNDRPKNNIPGGPKSVHAWAIGFDINCSKNRPGMKNSIDERVIAVFEEAGFVQLETDPMHFQYCTGY